MDGNVKSPWPGPAGMIPITSGKVDDVDVFNRNYLDSIHVEMRVIDVIEPILRTVIFGEEFDSPIVMPAFSHLNKMLKDGRKPILGYARIAKKPNTVNWVDMKPNEKCTEIAAEGVKTVRIIKSSTDRNIILGEIQFVVKHDAIAVGVDTDHVPGTDGRYGVVDGIPLGPVVLSGLKEYARVAGSIPFVVKGVFSVQDALKYKEAGCTTIVISYHHGRIPFGVAPVTVLPRIKAALEGSGTTIFVGCDIDANYDAYKALALGAGTITMGRGILKPLL